MPHPIASAPPPTPETGIPPQCVRCRGEGVVALALREEYERLQAAERALRGVQVALPKVFGGAAPDSLARVDERILELRKEFAMFAESAWVEFEEKERREQW